MAHECTHSRILMTLGASNNVNSAGHNEIYGYDECEALATEPDRAILNADNYKWYTQGSCESTRKISLRLNLKSRVLH